MYIPHYYKNENLDEVKEFIKQNSFGILISQVDQRPWATHLPLELEEGANGSQVLTGHIARANPQWKHFEEATDVMCVFNGPHSYISSSWYAKEEVPTWNYIAVHVYGTLSILSEEATMQSLHRLVEKYEQDSTHPISLKDMSPGTLRQVKGVVGFQVAISDIQAAYKLSQNREHDHESIIAELQKKEDPGAHAVARHMTRSSNSK